MRDKVKGFAQGAISGSSTMPPFKIIVLDEADSMTNDAQSALRRMMENYSKVTRFCLICNYVSRIIEPVASRCAKFRFAPLEKLSMATRIKYICTEEHIATSDEVIDSLLDCSNGDLRKAINFLQSAKQLCGDEELSKDDVIAVAGVRISWFLYRTFYMFAVSNVNFGSTYITLAGAAGPPGALLGVGYEQQL